MRSLLRSTEAFAGLVLVSCALAAASATGCNALSGVNDFVIEYEASADGTLAEGASGGDSASQSEGGRIDASIDATVDARLDAPRDAMDASTLDTSFVDAAAGPGLTLSTSAIDFGLANCAPPPPPPTPPTTNNMTAPP